MKIRFMLRSFVEIRAFIILSDLGPCPALKRTVGILNFAAWPREPCHRIGAQEQELIAMAPRLKPSSPPKTQPTESVADAYLALLADRGVEVLFGNAGTDFAPLIEAYAQAAQTGVTVPRPILATHENLAVTMAHGYGMVSRRIPAVMVHVSVGTA